MKKRSRILLTVIGSLLTLITIAAIFGILRFFDYDGIRQGMTYSEYISLIGEDVRFDMLDYSFYEKENGDCVVVHFDSATQSVDKVRVYPKFLIDNSKKTFDNIEPGMTIYKVVSLVGVPHGTATSGMISMIFDADDGTEYSVYFGFEDFSSENDLTVSRVTMLD